MDIVHDRSVTLANELGCGESSRGSKVTDPTNPSDQAGGIARNSHAGPSLCKRLRASGEKTFKELTTAIGLTKSPGVRPTISLGHRGVGGDAPADLSDAWGIGDRAIPLRLDAAWPNPSSACRRDLR